MSLRQVLALDWHTFAKSSRMYSATIYMMGAAMIIILAMYSRWAPFVMFLVFFVFCGCFDGIVSYAVDSTKRHSAMLYAAIFITGWVTIQAVHNMSIGIVGFGLYMVLGVLLEFFVPGWSMIFGASEISDPEEDDDFTSDLRTE